MAIFKNLYNKLLGEDGEEEELGTEDSEIDDGAEIEEEAQNPAPVQTSSKALELKVVKPATYDGNIMKIADHLLKKRTVVLNLEATSKEASRRIIDFLSGVAYSIGGQLKPIANNTYIITPNNVDVSSDKLQEAKVQASEHADEPGHEEF